MDTQHFPFYIILSNYLISILFYQNKDHKGFMFVQRCIVVKDVSVKERNFPDNLIQLENKVALRVSLYKPFRLFSCPESSPAIPRLYFDSPYIGLRRVARNLLKSVNKSHVARSRTC